MHLPPLPVAKDNPLARLLVSPKTAPDLGWSLIEEVDPYTIIDGLPLLQVFCKERAQRSEYTIHGSSDPALHPLPTHANEPWPDPRQRADGKWSDDFGGVEMWVFAHLVCNGPDPFAWKDEEGRDVLDHVVRWNNPQLLHQLLRMPSCPPVKELVSRWFNPARRVPWLHGLIAADHAKMAKVLLDAGFDPNQRMAKKCAALHLAASAAGVEVLVQAGADPLVLDKDGLSAPSAWSAAAGLSRSGAPSMLQYTLENRVDAWIETALAKDPEKTKVALAPLLFDAIAAGKSPAMLTKASARLGMKTQDWIHPATGRTLVHTLSLASLRAEKSSVVPRLVSLVKPLSIEALSRKDEDGITDMAWCWLATRRYGTPSEGAQQLGRVVDSFNQDPVQAIHELWTHATRLAHAPFPANKSKLLDAIKTACGGEITALVNERTQLASKGTPSPRMAAIQQRPEHLVRLARWPMQENPGLALLGVLREMSINQPELNPWNMMALAGMLQRGTTSDRLTDGVFKNLQALVDEGVVWDNTLPDAAAALQTVQQAAANTPHRAAVAAALVASSIAQQTLVPTHHHPRHRL